MKKRKFKSAAHARLTRELEASFKALKKKHAKPLERGSQKPVTGKPQGVSPTAFLDRLNLMRSLGRVPDLPSVQSTDLVQNTPKQTYEGEMAERERLAQQEIEQKRRRTAPVYNKGGAVYFTDDMIEDMKSGSLRRRP